MEVKFLHKWDQIWCPYYRDFPFLEILIVEVPPLPLCRRDFPTQRKGRRENCLLLTLICKAKLNIMTTKKSRRNTDGGHQLGETFIFPPCNLRLFDYSAAYWCGLHIEWNCHRWGKLSLCIQQALLVHFSKSVWLWKSSAIIKYIFFEEEYVYSECS